MLYTGLDSSGTSCDPFKPRHCLMLTRVDSQALEEDLAGVGLGGGCPQGDTPPRSGASVPISASPEGLESLTLSATGPASPVDPVSRALDAAVQARPSRGGASPAAKPPTKSTRAPDPRFLFNTEVKTKVANNWIMCGDRVFKIGGNADGYGDADAGAFEEAWEQKIKAPSEYYDASGVVHENIPFTKVGGRLLRNNCVWKGQRVRDGLAPVVQEVVKQVEELRGDGSLPRHMDRVLANKHPVTLCITPLGSGGGAKAVGVVAAEAIEPCTCVFMFRGARRALEAGDVCGQKVVVQRPCAVRKVAARVPAHMQAIQDAPPGVCDGDDDPFWCRVAECVLDATRCGGVAAYTRLSADAGKPANLHREDVLVPWCPTITLFFTTRKIFKGEELVR